MFHSHSERQAQIAIDSHGQPDHTLSPEALEMRRRKHTGVELSGVELPVLNNIVLEKLRAIENEISGLELSLEEHTAPNEANAQEKLAGLRQYHDMVKNNLAEKLSGELPNADNEIVI